MCTLYICIVQNNGSSDLKRDEAAQSNCAPVNAFNAHLRVMHQASGEFRIVLTFHHSDGQLCEAVLTPLEASVLVSEIADVLEDGDRRVSRSELEQSAR
jgi:hypothetical protein